MFPNSFSYESVTVHLHLRSQYFFDRGSRWDRNRGHTFRYGRHRGETLRITFRTVAREVQNSIGMRRRPNDIPTRGSKSTRCGNLLTSSPCLSKRFCCIMALEEGRVVRPGVFNFQLIALYYVIFFIFIDMRDRIYFCLV